MGILQSVNAIRATGFSVSAFLAHAASAEAVRRSLSRSALFAALTSVLFPLLVTACTAETEPFQSQAHFKAAIRDESSSPHFILVTVVDDRTGKVTTGCTLAPFLVGAIVRERDDWNDWHGEEAKRIALTNESHVFHFTKQSALDNLLPLDRDARYQEACIAIKSGQSARMGDRGGNLILGPFVEGPSVVWSSCAPAAFPADVDPAKRGLANIALLVGSDGSVKDSKVASTSGSALLDEATRAALSACKFTPRTIDGEPAPDAVWMTFKIGTRWPFPEPLGSAGSTPR